jgi:hypothetical protein
MILNYAKILSINYCIMAMTGMSVTSLIADFSLVISLTIYSIIDNTNNVQYTCLKLLDSINLTCNLFIKLKNLKFRNKAAHC